MNIEIITLLEAFLRRYSSSWSSWWRHSWGDAPYNDHHHHGQGHGHHHHGVHLVGGILEEMLRRLSSVSCCYFSHHLLRLVDKMIMMFMWGLQLMISLVVILVVTWSWFIWWFMIMVFMWWLQLMTLINNIIGGHWSRHSCDDLVKISRADQPARRLRHKPPEISFHSNILQSPLQWNIWKS